MADVRSMLRAERASRRITHPHASYTSDGKLLCNLCETLVKSEAQWQSHLHSTQHVLRSQRAQDAREARTQSSSESNGKKRKAETLESPLSDKVEDRKRKRPADDVEKNTDHPGLQRGEGGKRVRIEEDRKILSEPAASTPTTTQPTLEQHTEPVATVDEDEYAAFERAIADVSASVPTSALNAEATISAAPMTADALAAQARQEQSTQRGRRDREIEEEREDAARAMEEEFDEMEGLEERVKRLRERREALRVMSPEVEGGGVPIEVVENSVVRDEEDDGSSDEDEDDAWGFGGS